MSELQNGYVCYYRAKRWECYANTTREAQLKAASYWKVAARQQHLISVYLAEKGGEEVIQTAS